MTTSVRDVVTRVHLNIRFFSTVRRNRDRILVPETTQVDYNVSVQRHQKTGRDGLCARLSAKHRHDANPTLDLYLVVLETSIKPGKNHTYCQMCPSGRIPVFAPSIPSIHRHPCRYYSCNTPIFIVSSRLGSLTSRWPCSSTSSSRWRRH